MVIIYGDETSMIVLQIIVFLLGLGLTLATLSSAIRQTVLPGRKSVRLSRTLFRTTFLLFRLVIVRVQSKAVSSALFSSTVDREDVPWVHLCFQAGCRTLRDIVTEVA